MYPFFTHLFLCIALVFLLAPNAHSDPFIQVYTENSPPYQYVRNGKVEGEVTKRVRAIIKQAGYQSNFTVYPWARAMLNVKRNSHALIYAIAKTPEREQAFRWIAPVVTFKLGILTLTERKDIQIVEWDDLAGLSAATQRGDIAQQWLKEQGYEEGRNLISCQDIICSWQELKRGTVDFIIEDPRLIKDTARLIGLKPNDVTMQRLIPALSIDAYLAANKHMPDTVVQRLREAATLTEF